MKLTGIIKEAANAHTRLSTFHSLIAILEGGCLPGGSETADKTALKIIKLCWAEGARQLQMYDEAVIAGRRALATKEEGDE